MTNIFLFDVDGTLTPKGAAMTEDVAQEFEKFAAKYPTFLATSKTYQDLRMMLPAKVLKRCKGIYCSSGSEYYENGLNIYQKRHLFSGLLEASCDAFIKQSGFRYKTSRHMSKRPGMLTISVVGGKASRAERLRYMIWDRATGERRKFITMINESELKYDAFLGGSTNIEIMPNDQNKSAIADDLLERYSASRITFFGDRIGEFGHDLPLAERLREMSIYNRVISVGNYEHTKHHLKRMLSASAKVAS